MKSVSDEFLAALRGPHHMVVEVDLLEFGQVIVPHLAVIDGTVTLDAGASIYATCEITVIAPDLPLGTSNPFGDELAIRRGITGHRATPELIPLGVFKITAFDLDSVSNELRLSGMDRSKFAADARLEDDVEFANGTLVTDAIEQFMSVAVPHARQVLGASPHTIPLSVFEITSNPWDAVQELVGAIGKNARFDGIGTLRLYDVTSIAAPVAWTVDEGAQGVLVSASLAASDDEIFNRVIAASPPNDAGVVYRAVVTDTTSTARYGGPFGRKPDFIQSDLFTSDQMALDAATARLNSIIGSARSVSFGAVPNCALEAGDVILLRNERLQMDTKHIIQTLTIGLSSETAMTGTTRAVGEPGDASLIPIDVLFENFTSIVEWTGSMTSVAGGRTGNMGRLAGTSNSSFTIPTANESAYVTVGFAYKIDSLSTTRPFLYLTSDADVTNHVSFQVLNTGAIRVLRGGTAGSPLGTTAAGVVVINTWLYFEAQVYLHDSNGTVVMQANGAQVLNLNNQDTRLAGTKLVFDTVRLAGGGTGSIANFDDLYITVGAGASFKGNITVP